MSSKNKKRNCFKKLFALVVAVNKATTAEGSCGYSLVDTANAIFRFDRFGAKAFRFWLFQERERERSNFREIFSMLVLAWELPITVIVTFHICFSVAMRRCYCQKTEPGPRFETFSYHQTSLPDEQQRLCVERFVLGKR